MNAASLYISTCKLVMSFRDDGITGQPVRKTDTENNLILHDLYRLLPYLNQCLSCVVCDKLLSDPHSAKSGICQHYVCQSCLYGKKRSKASCESCRDCSTYQEDIHLSTLVGCYRQLCNYILSVPSLSTHISAAVSASDGKSLIDMIKTCAVSSKVSEVAPAEIGLSRSVYSMLPCLYSPANSSKLKRKLANEESASNNATRSERSISTALSNYTVVQVSEGNSTKITIKRNSPDKEESKSMQDRNESQPKVKVSCRCGLATPIPGKLTCCGQRCACYIDQQPCIDCKCKGCRNPFNRKNIIVPSQRVKINQEKIRIHPKQVTFRPTHPMKGKNLVSLYPKKLNTSYTFADSLTSESPYSSPEYTYSPSGSSNLLIGLDAKLPEALLVDDEVCASASSED